MTPLTEAELLKMREVQAKATLGLWSRGSSASSGVLVRSENKTLAELYGDSAWDNALFVILARTDWPRVTEWALEARRLLATILEMPAIKRLDYEDGSPWIRTQVNEAWIDEARRLLGEQKDA